MTPFIRTFVVLLAFTLSAAHALTLEEALGSVSERTAVVTARTELRDAVVNLERVQGDPLAVSSETLQAEQRLALARTTFEQTYYSAVQEVASAYTDVLQARKGLEVAQEGVSVSEASLNIAQIRLQNGSGTQLDLDEARTSFNEAENSFRSSRDNLNVALNNLESILGQEFEASALEPVPDNYLVQIPELERVLNAAEQHPTVLQAEQGLELAQLNLTLLDPSYASRSQIDGAETGVVNAREGLQETERSFRIQARNLFNGTESAQETYRVEQEALKTANERLQTQRERFEGGLIAQIELSQAELSNLQAELEARGARYGYLTSLLNLQAGTFVNLAGPDTLDAPSAAQIEASVGSTRENAQAAWNAAGEQVSRAAPNAPDANLEEIQEADVQNE